MDGAKAGRLFLGIPLPDDVRGALQSHLRDAFASGCPDARCRRPTGT